MHVAHHTRSLTHCLDNISKGIGKAIALEAAKQGVSQIVIMARNIASLEAAKKEIQAATTSEKTSVSAFSVDVSDVKAVESAAKSIFAQDGGVEMTHLFCCAAGEPSPDYFEKVSSDSFAKLTNVNQLGSICTAQKMLSYMKVGSITFCSSMAGQVGVFGYASYCPTKFALRGFAEVLHMELCNKPIHVQLAFPPDTDTPTYEKENLNKPEECRLISEVAGLADPKDVGKTMFHEAIKENPSFNVYFSFDGWLLSTLTAGFSPATTLQDAVSQIGVMSLARWISLFYLKDWHRIIRNYQSSRPKQEDLTTTASPSETSKSD